MEPEVAGFQQARQDLGLAVMALRGIKPPRQKPGEQALDVQSLTDLVCEASAPLLQASRYRVEGINSMQPCRLRELLLREVWRPVLTRVALLARQLAAETAAGLAPGPRSGKAPPGMLSMGDFNNLRTALEVLSLWGIYPHLEEGVGLALGRRPETKAVMVSRAVLAWGMAASSDIAECASDSDEKQRRAMQEDLLACGEVLEMAMGISQFSSLLTARYSTDALALYLQLSIRCPDGDVRRTASERLDRLSSRLSAYQLVCNLRELLSGGGVVPGWLRRECAARMTSVLMSAGGLRAVVEAFVGHLPRDAEHIEAAHMRLAQLIASRPNAVSAAEYTSKLGPQLAGLLHTRTDDRPLLARLCAVVIGRLSHRMPQETWDHVLTPLLQPLLALGPGSPYEPQLDSSTTEGGVVWPEEDVSTALDDLNTLLTYAPPPPAFINVLATQGSWRLAGPLMELWAFAGRTGASVAEKVEAVLMEMLTRSTQVAHILLLDGYLYMTHAGRGSEGRNEVGFARGGQGGVMVVRRATTAHPEAAETALEELRSLSLSSVEKDLARADEDAGAVALLVSGLGPQSQTPGLLFERLLLAYIRIKTPPDALNIETLASHCSPENRDAVEGQQEPQGFIATAVLMKLFEKIAALGAGLFGSGAQIIRCCALLLHLATQSPEAHGGSSDEPQDMELGEGRESQEGGEPSGESDVEELGAVVMSVLLVVLELGEDTRPEPEETALRELLPLLLKITQRSEGAASHASRGLVEMALSLQAAVLTRSLSLAERAEMKAREAKAAEARAHGPEGLREVLQDVEDDLQSALPPLRARGISTLTKMVHSIPKEKLVKLHDGSARNEEPQRVVEVLIRMLGDHESFVYLAAVHGLAVMSEKVPSVVISRLLEVMGDETFPWAQRLKAGEALVQAAMHCGEAMPKYAPLVVAAFVKGARQTMMTPHTSATTTQGEDAVERAHFRLSCLSALAEVCGLLRCSIPRYLEDVCDLAIGLLTHEQPRRQSAARPSQRATLIEEIIEDRGHVPASEVVQDQVLVNRSGDDQGAAEWSQEASQGCEQLTELSALARRGAAFLLGRLLSGSGPDVQSVLGGKLTVIKQTLVTVAETDSDAVTRLHASRALGTLEDALWQQVEWRLDADRVMAARPIEQLTRRLQGRHAVEDAVRDMGLE